MITLSRFGTTVTPVKVGALVNLKFGPVGSAAGDVPEVVEAPDEELDELAVVPPEEELDELAVVPPEEELDELAVAPPEEELDELAVAPPDEELDELAVVPPEEELDELAVAPPDEELAVVLLAVSVAAAGLPLEEFDEVHPVVAATHEAINNHPNLGNSFRPLDMIKCSYFDRVNAPPMDEMLRETILGKECRETSTARVCSMFNLM